MNHIDDKEAIELLRKAGCTASEIERYVGCVENTLKKREVRLLGTIAAPGLPVGW